MSFVVDASVVLRLLTGQRTDDLLRRRIVRSAPVHAPHHIDAEVANGVRGLCLGRKIDSTRLREAVDDYASLRIVRHEIVPLIDRALEFRHNLSAYDAFYLTLAEVLGVEFLTCDAGLADVATHHVKVHHYQ